MKRTLLVFPGFPYYAPNGRPPLGLGYLASALRQNGYDAKILDLTLYSPSTAALAGTLDGYKPDYVLFSVLTPTYPGLRANLEQVRKSGRVKAVILGGPHATADPEGVLKDFPAVIVARGEGENTVVELLNALEGGKELSGVRGINYVLKGETRSTPARPFIADLSDLPMPALDLMEIGKYQECLEAKKIVSIATGRGCSFPCVYCPLHGQNRAVRSPESIIKEIKHVINVCDRRAFNFVDELFTLEEERVLELCRLIKEEKLDIIWRCLTRVDLVCERLLAAMYDAGCRMIGFGVESCDDRVLREIRKGYTCAKVAETFERTGRTGLKTKAYMMLGLPGDTAQSMFATIDRSRSLNADYIQFSLAIPFPGTEFRTWMSGKGLLPQEDAWAYYKMANLEQAALSPEEIERLPLCVPAGFTKSAMYELYLLANGLAKMNEFRIKYRKRGRFGIVLSAGRHPVSLAQALSAWSRYGRFKARFLRS